MHSEDMPNSSHNADVMKGGVAGVACLGGDGMVKGDGVGDSGGKVKGDEDEKMI